MFYVFESSLKNQPFETETFHEKVEVQPKTLNVPSGIQERCYHKRDSIETEPSNVSNPSEDQHMGECSAIKLSLATRVLLGSNWGAMCAIRPFPKRKFGV